MENLHLSYAEVVDVFPYRHLLIMAKDKQHVAYGDVYEEVDETEFFKRKGKDNPFLKDAKTDKKDNK